jgi:type II secretory pathway predicted ATPase ExeA
MLTEVMRFYGLARPPVDAGFFETEHHAQVSRDIRAAIVGGRLIALTAVIGSGKTVLSRRLRAELEREGGSSCRARCRSTRRRSAFHCWKRHCSTT